MGHMNARCVRSKGRIEISASAVPMHRSGLPPAHGQGTSRGFRVRFQRTSSSQISRGLAPKTDPVHAVSACSSLLTTVNEDTQVIQFSHLSVKEFLTSDHLSKANDTISHYHISTMPAHTLVARVCLGILLHLPEDVTSDDLEKFPLAGYAAEYWVDHARFEDVSQEVEDGMKELFDPRKSHLAVWTWIYDQTDPYWRPNGTSQNSVETEQNCIALCGVLRLTQDCKIPNRGALTGRGSSWLRRQVHCIVCGIGPGTR
jgi:hypothetical protein